jgi:hypothetical protein
MPFDPELDPDSERSAFFEDQTREFLPFGRLQQFFEWPAYLM